MARRIPLIAALVALTLINCRAFAQDKADDSTPKGVVSGFFKAMQSGDVAAAKSMAAGSEQQLATLDVLVPLVSGFKQLENAAFKKWGDEGKKALSQDGTSSSVDIEKELQDAKVEENGDSAVVAPGNASKTKEPMKLKKVEGKWKVDMSSIPAKGLDDPNTTRILKAMGEIAKSTAVEVDAGKYQSAADVKKAVGEKMRPLIMSGAGGQPAQPTTPTQPQK